MELTKPGREEPDIVKVGRMVPHVVSITTLPELSVIWREMFG